LKLGIGGISARQSCREARLRDRTALRAQAKGIRRAAYARGLADLQVLANLISASEYVHGAKPTSIDAAIYGFIANIYFLEIDTPRKKFVVAHGLVRHCTAIRAAIG
jgi:glutathione S-transferase